MSAQPVQEHDPDDPVETLRVLPEQFREQFLNEYALAAEAARRPEGYRALHDLLRLWRLTAAAYSEPGFEARCYRPRYLNIQRLDYLWTIRHSSAGIAGNLIT